MSEALVLDGIEKGYNRGKPSEVQVLRGATLSVAAGEVGHPGFEAAQASRDDGRFGLRFCP